MLVLLPYIFVASNYNNGFSVPVNFNTSEIYPLQGNACTIYAVVSAINSLNNFPIVSAAFNFQFKVPGGAWTDITSVPYLSSVNVQPFMSATPGKAVFQAIRFTPVVPISVRCQTAVLSGVISGPWVYGTSNTWTICAVPDPRFAYAANGESGTERYQRLFAGGYV